MKSGSVILLTEETHLLCIADPTGSDQYDLATQIDVPVLQQPEITRLSIVRVQDGTLDPNRRRLDPSVEQNNCSFLI